MAEQVLEESRILDTVVIHPGDLVDDERPDNVTVQVQASDSMDQPAVVGREDVAALAVACSLLPSHQFLRSTRKQGKSQVEDDTTARTQSLLRRRKKTSPLLKPSSSPPFHCTVGVRWTGDTGAMSPYPAQGRASDGHPEASQGFRNALQEDHKVKEGSQMVKVKLQKAEDATKGSTAVASSMNTALKRRRLKPYAVCLAIPLYLLVTLITTTILQNVIAGLVGAGIASTGGPMAGTSQRLAQLTAQQSWTSGVTRCSKWFISTWSTIVHNAPQWICYRSAKTTTGKFITI